MSGSLFDVVAPKPLAERLRPTRLEDVVGQDHLLGPDGPIGRMAKAKRLSSMILFGPPGVGKTTIAKLLARIANMEFEPLSAPQVGVLELRKVVETAKSRRLGGRSTLLFVDEIHRWNKAQQDSLLPVVEDGTITLVGATTENPSFELNAAILSRVQVMVLNRFGTEALEQLLQRAEEEMKRPLPVTPEARDALLQLCDGDGRYLLNAAEMLFDPIPDAPLDIEAMGKVLQRRPPVYDKAGDGHYSLISALQKSIRGSDVDAAMYYLARMLLAGEEERYLFRRLVVIAAEDIGMADPNAIQVATACAAAFDRAGRPEGHIPLAQCVAYLATAPKSNASYMALKKAKEVAKETGSTPPPKHLINAPTALMKAMGFKDGYKDDHDYDEALSGQEFMPDALAGRNRPTFYEPTGRGYEARVIDRLNHWNEIRRSLKAQG